MMFSTKAEYGVRVMVDLARRGGRRPGAAGRDRRARGPAARLPRAPRRAAAPRRPDREPPRRPRRLSARAPGRARSRWPRSSRRSRARSRRSSASRARRRHDPLLARGRPRASLHDQAAVDARARRRSCTTLQETTLADLLPAASAATRAPLPTHHQIQTNGRSCVAWLNSRSQPARPHRGSRDPARRRPRRRPGELHALMGPNGSGKSTLANTIMGHPAYEVTEGEILFDGENIIEMAPHERASAGLFLAFQYPVAIPGVSVANFLRLAINAQREEPISVKEFGEQLAARGRAARRRPRLHLAPPQRRLLRRREEARRGPADGGARSRRSRCSTRPTRAWTSTRCAPSPRASRSSTRAGAGRADHHPLPADPPLRPPRVRAHPDGRPDRDGGRQRARRAPRARGLRPDPRGGRGAVPDA